jgi:hypothetical protein
MGTALSSRTKCRITSAAFRATMDSSITSKISIAVSIRASVFVGERSFVRDSYRRSTEAAMVMYVVLYHLALLSKHLSYLMKRKLTMFESRCEPCKLHRRFRWSFGPRRYTSRPPSLTHLMVGRALAHTGLRTVGREASSRCGTL